MSNLEAKVKVNKIIYPRNGISTGDFGIISCSVDEVIEGEPALDKWGSITVKGTMPEINLFDTYKLIGKLVKDQNYGWQYEIVYMGTQYDMTDEREQKIFLSHILTENQLNELFNTYSNPIQYIENEDVSALCKVKGIGAAVANRIIQKYKDTVDYSSILIELDGYGLTNTMINKLVNTYQSPEVVIQKVKENPYILADEVEGIGWGKADSIALKTGIDNVSPFRIQAFLKHYLEQEAQKGNSWVYPSDLLYAVEEMLGEDIDQEHFKKILYTMFENEELYWNSEKTFIALRKYYDLEKNIKNELMRLLKAENKFEYSDYELKLSLIEEYQGWQYTDKQKEAIVTALKNNVVIITGGAGTGKSSSIKGFLDIMNNYSFAQTALSGKAAARLTELSGVKGSTIHKLLGYSPREGFAYNKDFPLKYDIIILDETSMVGAELFYQLIQAIKTGAKLIMLGDIGQLEAIGLANVFNDMIDSGVIPVVILDKIHRQAQKSAIITNSMEVRNGNQIVKQGWTGIETRGELQDLIVDIYDDKILTAPAVMNWFKKEYEENPNIMDIQIIVPLKERGDACTFELNNSIQEYYNPADKRKRETTVTKNKKTYILREGDKVINVVNNYKTTDEDGNEQPIFNGYVGIIKLIEYDYMIIDFDICGRVMIYKKFWKNIEPAYALTCHKLQGSQAKTVIIGLDYTAYTLLTKEWVYTALTRASKKCILCAESSALRFAVSNSNIQTKQTFLAKMLN
jgi:exodeoxyribonuclease V alpha subunit